LGEQPLVSCRSVFVLFVTLSHLFRQFADRTAQFLPGKFHEYKNEQDFVRAYFADAKKYGVTRQKLMAMLPPPEDEPDEPPNIALASRRNSPIHLIGFVLALGFVLFMMPEHRAIISMLVFIIVVGVLAHFPSII